MISLAVRLLKRSFLLSFPLVLFQACTSAPKSSTDEATNAESPSETSATVAWHAPESWRQNGVLAKSQWQHFTFPGKKITSYRITQNEGRDAVLASSQSSASVLRTDVLLPADSIYKIKFSWKVPKHLTDADITVPELDDSPVRVFLTFEGDRNKFSAKNALISEMANLLLGEPLPYATLVYLWSKRQPLGSVILGLRTDRVRNIVIETGSANLNKWLDYERDIRADYEKAFGEKPGKLLRIALMTDSDNTKSQTTAWYGVPSFIVK